MEKNFKDYKKITDQGHSIGLATALHMNMLKKFMQTKTVSLRNFIKYMML